MTAELRVQSPPLPLLFEPDRPDLDGKERPVYQGYRRVMVRECGVLVRTAVRDHSDDAWGAMAQRLVARYVIGGESRAALAAEHGMTVDAVQNYFKGATMKAYTRPVLRACRRLGISSGRGDRTHGGERMRELVAAHQQVTARLLADEVDPNAIADARLLMAPLEASSR